MLLLVCSALARRNGYQLAYNQEIVALGIANFAGALFNSYTTTGSFSRSAINNSCGAKTQLSGFVTSIIVMCVLLFLVSHAARSIGHPDGAESCLLVAACHDWALHAAFSGCGIVSWLWELTICTANCT